MRVETANPAPSCSWKGARRYLLASIVLAVAATVYLHTMMFFYLLALNVTWLIYPAEACWPMRLWLSIVAYNPGELVAVVGAARRDRGLVAPSLQQRVVKIGGRLVKHARYYRLMLAEGHLTRGRFAAMRPAPSPRSR